MPATEEIAGDLAQYPVIRKMLVKAGRVVDIKRRSVALIRFLSRDEYAACLVAYCAGCIHCPTSRFQNHAVSATDTVESVGVTRLQPHTYRSPLPLIFLVKRGCHTIAPVSRR